MKQLFAYLRAYWKECVFAPMLKLLEASFELFVPLVIASLVDRGIEHADRAYIWKMCLLLVLLAAVGLISAVSAQYLSARAAVGFGKHARSALFRRIQELSFRQLDQIGSDTLLTRITADVTQVQNGVNMLLRLFLRSPFIVFGAVIMAFTIDTRSALVFTAMVAVLFAVVIGITLWAIPRQTKVQQALDHLTRLVKENLTGTRVIRAFNRQKEEVARFAKQNQDLTRLQLNAASFSSALGPLTFVIVNVSLIVLIKVGAIRTDIGRLTQGELVALINYMSQILVELLKLTNLIVMLNKAYASARRLGEILQLQPDMNDPSDAPQGDGSGDVCFTDVTLSYYEKAEPAISGISFCAPRGSTVGILGGTGSGKSTLVHALCRFYDVTSGTITLDGVDIRDYPKSELRRRIAIVMQRAVLFAGTVRDNLQMGAPNCDADGMESALADAQAYDFVMNKNGLETGVDAQGRNFSGGQRQRLSVARALAKRADILILDDSGSALDYATDAKMRSAVAALPYHPTVFIVSQRISSVMHADQILVLDEGRLCGKGTHAQLLANCEEYREIYASQFSEELPDLPGNKKEGAPL